MPLKVLGIQASVFFKLVLGPGIWLTLSIFVSWPSTLANCLLVLSLQWGFDHKWVKEVSLLDIRLVTRLVVGASFQLGSLSTEIILGPGTGKTVQPSWIV